MDKVIVYYIPVLLLILAVVENSVLVNARPTEKIRYLASAYEREQYEI